METFDAIVVGLGAHGSAAAAELARRGLRVVGLERFGRGEAMGSSGGRSRMIRIAHFETPDYVPIARASWARWRALEIEAGLEILRAWPGLYAGAPDSPVVAGSLAAVRAGAVAHEILDADAIRSRWPVFVPADDTIAVVDAEAGIVRADRAIEAHLIVTERLGGTLRFGSQVVDWRPAAGGGFEAELPDGTAVGGDRLVLTAGPWTSSLVPDLRLPLVVERQPVLWLAPAGRVPVSTLGLADLPLWLWATPAGTFYGFPWDDELGLKIALHHGGASVSPDVVDRMVGSSDEADVRAFVRDRMPAMDGPLRNSTVCLYTNAPDDEFVIDRHPAAPGVAFASACSGHGFKFAPVVGEILADLVTTGSMAWPIEAFRADRFRDGGAGVAPR
jgi:sarcosine oxidase